MTDVLGVEVTPDLMRAWAAWLAPDPQPFLVADLEELDDASTGTITPELRDTFCLWRAAPGSRVLWLTEAQFAALPRARRAALVREQVNRGRGAVPTVRAWQDHLDAAALRAQADGHRFVWWPSLFTTDAAGILTRQVSLHRLPSRHREVRASTWRRCQNRLPGARALAGTFTNGSNACCYSTVMEAAGADTTGSCDSTEPFLRWLDAACTPGGDTNRAGTVLVWRTHDGPVHAAVTIGDGWALEKPSQEWHSPRTIARVTDVVRMARMPGQRVERWTITP